MSGIKFSKGTVTLEPGQSLAFPPNVVGLTPGMRINVYTVPTWYQKLWAWFKVRVLRIPPPPPPAPRVITHIDHETRTITYDYSH